MSRLLLPCRLRLLDMQWYRVDEMNDISSASQVQ
jgi:hypothetical protein